MLNDLPIDRNKHRVVIVVLLDVSGAFRAIDKSVLDRMKTLHGTDGIVWELFSLPSQ